MHHLGRKLRQRHISFQERDKEEYVRLPGQRVDGYGCDLYFVSLTTTKYLSGKSDTPFTYFDGNAKESDRVKALAPKIFKDILVFTDTKKNKVAKRIAAADSILKTGGREEKIRCATYNTTQKALCY
eukprot:1335976-Amorphochlora_amoeboformis.AAC.1